MQPADVIQPTVIAFRNDWQNDVVIRVTFNHVSHNAIVNRSNAERIRQHNWGLDPPRFVCPCQSCRLTVTVDRITRTKQLICPNIIAWDDSSNACPNTVTVFQRDMPYLHPCDIRDCIVFAGLVNADFDTEISCPCPAFGNAITLVGVGRCPTPYQTQAQAEP